MSPPYCFYLVPLSLIASWLIAIPDLVGRDKISPANLYLLPIILYNTYNLPGTAMTCFHRALALPLWNLNPLPRIGRAFTSTIYAYQLTYFTTYLWTCPKQYSLAPPYIEQSLFHCLTDRKHSQTRQDLPSHLLDRILLSTTTTTYDLLLPSKKSLANYLHPFKPIARTTDLLVLYHLLPPFWNHFMGR